MSRGHGRIQLQVLDMLFSHSLQSQKREIDTYLSVWEMAEQLTPEDQEYIDRSLVESIRRAIKKLEAEGEVEVRKILGGRPSVRGKRGWEPKRMLAARLPMSDEDLEFYRQKFAAEVEELGQRFGW